METDIPLSSFHQKLSAKFPHRILGIISESDTGNILSQKLMPKVGKVAVMDLNHIGDGHQGGFPRLKNYTLDNNTYNPSADFNTGMEHPYDNVIRTNFSNINNNPIISSSSFPWHFNNNYDTTMLHTTSANTDKCISRSSTTTLIPSQYNDSNKLPCFPGISSDHMNTFDNSMMQYSINSAAFHIHHNNNSSSYNNNNNCSSGSLVLDSSRGELVSASAILTRTDVNAKAMAASKIHSEAEKRRRERINSHLATLRAILPNSMKTDKATLLAEVIVELKRLKRKLSDVYHCDADKLSMPTENNELNVEKDQSSTKDRLILRVSLCCDDRPDLMREIKCSLDTLELQTLKVYISTLGGRIKNVFILVLKEHEKFKNGQQDVSMLIKQVEEALKHVIEIRSERSDKFITI